MGEEMTDNPIKDDQIGEAAMITDGMVPTVDGVPTELSQVC
jgi:hypothetical protein